MAFPIQPFRGPHPYLAHFIGSGDPRQCRLVAAPLGGQQPEVALEFQTTSFGFETETFVYQHLPDGKPAETVASFKWTTSNMLGTARMGERQVHMADLAQTVANDPNCRAFHFVWPEEDPMVCMWQKVGVDTYTLWVNTDCMMEYHPGLEIVAGENDGDPPRHVFGTIRWIDRQQAQPQ